jgi:hypothetical protein
MSGSAPWKARWPILLVIAANIDESLTNMRADVNEMRVEMRSEFRAVRHEMRGASPEVRRDLQRLAVDLADVKGRT